jgi:hypothetical protein
LFLSPAKLFFKKLCCGKYLDYEHWRNLEEVANTFPLFLYLRIVFLVTALKKANKKLRLGGKGFVYIRIGSNKSLIFF